MNEQLTKKKKVVEKDNFVEAICPRCGWTYNCQLTEKYLKVKEQKEMAEAIKSHEC